MHDAWKSLSSVEFPKDGSEGRAGVIWVPTSIDPKNATRSYARTGHYERVKSRSNYHLLTGHKGSKVEFSSRHGSITAEGVIITSRSGNGTTVKVNARKEIILAAGAIHSPQILQRSGVGPKVLLESANITLAHELPGVGQNFHDHSYFPIKYECKSFEMSTCKFPADEGRSKQYFAESGYAPNEQDFFQMGRRSLGDKQNR